MPDVPDRASKAFARMFRTGLRPNLDRRLGPPDPGHADGVWRAFCETPLLFAEWLSDFVDYFHGASRLHVEFGGWRVDDFCYEACE